MTKPTQNTRTEPSRHADSLKAWAEAVSRSGTLPGQLTLTPQAPDAPVATRIT